MTPDFSSRTIAAETLVKEASVYQKEGYRLVQISAVRLPEELELTYSFDKETRMEHLRVRVPASGTRVPSISSVYWCAFLYENELHDLFDVQVDGLAVDFHGSFYKTSVKFPFGSTKAPTAKSRVPAAPTGSPGSTPAAPARKNGASGSASEASPPAHLN
jgi:ech hydrogenase subunit D